MITASIVVDFGFLNADGHIMAELDAEKNMDKTSFAAGEDVYFRVYADLNYGVSSTAGRVIKQETKTETDTITELVSFLEVQTTTAQKLIKIGSESITWYGNDGGAITQTGTTQISVVTPELLIGSLEYKSEYDLWKLSPPASMSDPFSILILIKAL